jgi:hypothetical protein
MTQIEAKRDWKLAPNIDALLGYRTELGMHISAKVAQDGKSTSRHIVSYHGTMIYLYLRKRGTLLISNLCWRNGQGYVTDRQDSSGRTPLHVSLIEAAKI